MVIVYSRPSLPLLTGYLPHTLSPHSSHSGGLFQNDYDNTGDKEGENIELLLEEFKDAASRVKVFPSLSNTQLGEIYSLYKQTTVGNNTKPRPGGLLNLTEKGKWDVWESKKGLTKHAAMKQYIDYVNRLH